MTVSTNISSVRYEGNGVTDTFSFNGRIFTNSDLSVDIITRTTDAVVETLAPSDYTVSLVSSESAEIVIVGPKIPSSSQDILIYRNISINQSLRLPTGTVFPASDVESALDRLTTIIQDSQDDGSRSLVFPKNISGITTPYLPSPEDGKLLVWDGETGNVANLSITNLIDEGFNTVFTSLIATDFLQYNGVSWVNIHNSDFPLQSIKAPTSSGIVLKNNSGTAILTIGSGGASSATFAGTLNIPDGTVSTTAKIVDGIVTYVKMAAAAIAAASDILAGTASKIVNAANLKSYFDTYIYPRMPKAYGNFNGASGGTVLRSGYNVSSVTRSSTGTYSVTFTNALPSADYTVVATCGGNNLNTTTTFGNGYTQTTTGFSIVTYNANTGAAVDVQYGNFVVLYNS